VYFHFYIFKQIQQIKRKGNETFNTVMILSTVDDLNASNIEIGSKTLSFFKLYALFNNEITFTYTQNQT